jgi:hypothetical protein
MPMPCSFKFFVKGMFERICKNVIFFSFWNNFWA